MDRTERSRSSASIRGYYIQPRVKHILSGTAYALEVGGLNESYVVGAIRCVTGSKGGTECGAITNVDVDSTYTNYAGWTINRLVKLGNASDPFVTEKGDSGGPVYWLNFQDGYVLAAGICSALGPNCPLGDCWYAKFTRLSQIPDDWGVSIHTVEQAGCEPGGVVDPCPLTDPDDL